MAAVRLSALRVWLSLLAMLAGVFAFGALIFWLTRHAAGH